MLFHSQLHDSLKNEQPTVLAELAEWPLEEEKWFWCSFKFPFSRVAIIAFSGGSPLSSTSSFILAPSSVFVKSLFPGALVKKRSNNCLTLQLLEAVDGNVNK